MTLPNKCTIVQTLLQPLFSILFKLFQDIAESNEFRLSRAFKSRVNGWVIKQGSFRGGHKRSNPPLTVHVTYVLYPEAGREKTAYNQNPYRFPREFLLVRLAFVGTSIANTYFADLARNCGATSTFFEASSLGGAWGQVEFGGDDAPRFNNIVFPYSEAQEHEVGPLYEWLVSQSAEVKMLNNGFSSASQYRPRQIVAGNFGNAIRTVVESPEAILTRQRVERIDVLPSHVEVDGQEFDYVVLPLNAKIDRLTIKTNPGESAKTIELAWIMSRSEHVRICSETKIEGRVFCEYEDNVFDRFGVIPSSQNFCVGRVSKKWKGEPLDRLIQNSFATRNLSQSILSADMQFFSQERLSPNDASMLTSLTSGTRLVPLNTSDFITAVRHVRALIDRICRP